MTFTPDNRIVSFSRLHGKALKVTETGLLGIIFFRNYLHTATGVMPMSSFIVQKLAFCRFVFSNYPTFFVEKSSLYSFEIRRNGNYCYSKQT